MVKISDLKGSIFYLSIDKVNGPYYVNTVNTYTYFQPLCASSELSTVTTCFMIVNEGYILYIRLTKRKQTWRVKKYGACKLREIII
jgi:hypothetical protein